MLRLHCYAAVSVIGALAQSCSAIPMVAARSAARVAYPEGICADAEHTSPDSDPARAIARAEQALARGCPAEAQALLRVDAAQRARMTRPQLGTAMFLSAEATQDAFAMGPSRSDVINLQLEAMTASVRMNEVFLRIIQLTSGGIRENILPSALQTSGRYGRMITRVFPTFGCLQGVSVERARARYRETGEHRSELWRSVNALDPASGHGALELGVGALWDCELGDAREAFTAASERLQREGSLRDAAMARVLAAEAAHVPGGRISEMLVGSAPEGQRQRWAALEEAARRGAGPYPEAATGYEQGLDGALALAPGDPMIAAEVSWRRSASALRLRQDPARGAALATTAMALAARAQRADLVDAAGVVLMLAYRETHRWAEVEQIAAHLEHSFTRRGAIGMRERVLTTALQLADVDHFRGRSGDGIRLLQALGPLAAQGTPMGRVLYWGGLGRMLREAGRQPEAISAMRSAEEVLSQGESLPPEAAEPLRQIIAGYRSQIEASDGGLTAAEAEHAHAIDRAMAQGNPRVALALALESPPEAAWAGPLGAMEAGFCPRVVRDATVSAQRLGALIDQLGSLRDEAERTGNPMSTRLTGVRGQMISMAVSTSMALGLCGAAVSNPSAVASARALYSRIGVYGEVDPVMNEYFHAAELEARGQYSEASDAWVSVGRAHVTRRGVDRAGSLGVSGAAGGFFHRAVISALRASPARIDQAVTILEESQSRDLRASRASAATEGEGAELDAVRGVERSIESAQSRLRALAQLESATDLAAVREALATERGELARTIDGLQRDRETAARALQASHDGAYRMAALAPALTASELRQRLLPDESLVYLVTDAVTSFAVVIDREDARAVALPTLDAERLPRLSVELARFQSALVERLGQQGPTGRGLRVVAAAGQEAAARTPQALDGLLRSLRADLYQDLVRPLEAMIPARRRVIVVPDAATASLPFASLGAPESPWGARNPLRVLQGGFMLPARAEHTTLREGSALVVGDASFGASGRATSRGGSTPRATSTAAAAEWAALPGTRAEATAVAGLYGVSAVLGVDAQESQIRQRMAAASLVHLATHGLADVARPDYSAIMLSMPAQASDGDGILYAYEVERMRLHADLVVLSACETGLGQTRSAEGTLSLDRAFLVAGAGAVVSSLWVVNDASTEALMRAFHTRLRGGAPADVALSEAIAETRSDARWGDPYFWGAFRVVGPGLR